MRIHWLSNAPWAPTGYGNQTGLFVPRLKAAGHEMSVTAYYGLEGAVLDLGGIPIMPKGYHVYGADIAAANAKVHNADILISLMDTWVLNPAVMQEHGARWVPWFPIDAHPLPAVVRDGVSKAFARLTMSPHGNRMMEQAGLDYYYIPHGVDTEDYKPLDGAECRRELGIPEDAYVVGMVAANKGSPSRKNFCEQISAFEAFHVKHPDSIMYIHTYDGMGGHNMAVNLHEFVEGLGLEIGKDVWFPNQHQYKLGFPVDWMAKIYNSFDVFLNVSAGEGFGIPILEAQSCGVPVILGDWSSMSDLCFSGRLVSRKDSHPVYTNIGAYQFLPRIDAILHLMEAEFSRPSSRDAAREGAMLLDADAVVTNYWQPALADIERKISEIKANQELILSTPGSGDTESED